MSLKTVNRAIAATASTALIAVGLMGGPASAGPTPHAKLQITNVNKGVKAPSRLRAHTATLPYRNAPVAKALAKQSASATTVRTWSKSIRAYDGKVYPYTIVGKNPTVRQSSPSTTVKTVVIPTQITFADTGDVFDPTTGNCADATSPVQRFAKSPLYAKHSYRVGGKSIGSVQFVDMLQRAEFYKYTKPNALNPNYHVNLTNTTTGTLALTASGFPDTGTACDGLGFIDINAWDSFIQGVLADPASYGLPTSPTVLPVFLVHNVVFYVGDPGNCCILGYHSAFNNPAFGNAPQTYSTIDYDTSNNFGTAAQDVAIGAHELSEWANDPFINNPTPAWGHIGQVSGCQGNLEVGDPLTGTTQTVQVNGFTYHPQEEAFFGWFYGPNWGPGGAYSTNGTFRAHSTLCQ